MTTSELAVLRLRLERHLTQGVLSTALTRPVGEEYPAVYRLTGGRASVRITAQHGLRIVVQVRADRDSASPMTRDIEEDFAEVVRSEVLAFLLRSGVGVSFTVTVVAFPGDVRTVARYALAATDLTPFEWR